MLDFRRVWDSKYERKRSHHHSSDPFFRIGPDALRIICQMSRPRQLCALMVASRAFKGIADNTLLWTSFITQDFPLITEQQLKWRLSGTSAKEFYLEMAYDETGKDLDSIDEPGTDECILAGKLWQSYHLHIIPVLVPLLTLTITALIVSRLEHQEAHSRAVQRGVQASNVEALVGDIDHTWVALLWWLLLPIMGSGGLSLWYFRVWWRDLYEDIAGPFKSFVTTVLNDNISEMQYLCPVWILVLLGIGLLSLRVSNLVFSFSYWWVTFPLMIAPALLLGWAFQVASNCENVFDVIFAVGVSMFLTIPLISFTTLLTLYLNGNTDEVDPIDIMVPLFILEGVFLVVLCGLFLNNDTRIRHFYGFSSFCVVIPLMIFQVLLLFRVENNWSYGLTFAPCFIGEVFLLTCGCLWTARDLKLITLPNDVDVQDTPVDSIL
mmetsp:Transcript_19721/g.27352  ORF Transcript_19721/g.27352 Transcript_19721/m.27352 type:complete len:436 (+) Transcript_19721:218-1525(+)